MKKELKFANVNAFFVLVFLCFGLVFSVSAQDTNRQRVINGNKAKSTPTPIATKQTWTTLRSKINGQLANPLLRRGRVGIKVVSLNSGKTIYERNAESYYMPASNMKSFTVAAAIDKLSPTFRFVTSVYANSRPDSNGTIQGDLIIYGRGDPSISMGFNDGDYYKGIDALADKIIQSGVKRIDGNIIGDETYFKTKPTPYGWEWDDLQWYYGAEVSSLTINDNAVELKISPSSVGSSAIVNVFPNNRQFRIINRTITVSAGEKREIRVKKRLGQNILEVSGKIPENYKGYKGFIAVSRPARLFVEILKQRLQLKGVTVRGRTRAISLEERSGIKLPIENLTEITNLKSPPLSVIAAKTMKPSQNLYTELILRALGEEAGDKIDLEKTSLNKGVEVVQSFLQRAGIASDSVRQHDGSGLSRHNLITPNSSVKLYTFMNQNRYAVAWRNSLTVGGIDGTLERRFVGTSSLANVRGKTGTLNQVSALTGYVRSKSGEQFVFSILINNVPGSSRLRNAIIDKIVVSLSDFDGQIN